MSTDPSPKSPASTHSSPENQSKKSSPSPSSLRRRYDKRAWSKLSPTFSPSSTRPHHKVSLAGSETNSHKSRRSREGWIPDERRRAQIERDLSLAKENADAISRSELHAKRPGTSSSSLQALERSRSKERHGLEQRKACGLCCRPFLRINLTMAVPLKAILDMRDTWGDRYDPEGAAKVRAKTNPNLRRAPACYNQTRVCAFCSQLFDNQQDAYRPSFKTKEADKLSRELAEIEEQRKVKQAKDDDPLAEMKKERERLSLDRLKL